MEKKKVRVRQEVAGGHPGKPPAEVYSSGMRSWLRTNVGAAGGASSPAEVLLGGDLRQRST